MITQDGGFRATDSRDELQLQLLLRPILIHLSVFVVFQTWVPSGHHHQGLLENAEKITLW